MEEKESALSEFEEREEYIASREKQLLDDLAATKQEASEIKKLLEETEKELIQQREKEKASHASESERDRIERELNDEIETVKASKKKYKGLADTAAKELEAKEKETTRLEGEIKSLLQAEKQQRQATDDARAEVAMLRKQVKDLNAKVGSARSVSDLEVALKEKSVEIEKLNMQVKSIDTYVK